MQGVLPVSCGRAGRRGDRPANSSPRPAPRPAPRPVLATAAAGLAVLLAAHLLVGLAGRIAVSDLGGVVSALFGMSAVVVIALPCAIVFVGGLRRPPPVGGSASANPDEGAVRSATR